MKNSQKGFIQFIVIAILVLVITGAGWYGYEMNKIKIHLTKGDDIVSTTTQTTSLPQTEYVNENEGVYDTTVTNFSSKLNSKSPYLTEESKSILTSTSDNELVLQKNIDNTQVTSVFSNIASQASTSSSFIETYVSQLGNSFDMGVLVLKYFPTTVVNGQEVIDISVTGDISDPYDVIKQRTIDITNGLKAVLGKATSYLGYKNSSAQPALKYNIVDTIEYKMAVPTIVYDGRLRYPDYNGILKKHNICDYVDNKGVREVWLFAYQGPAKADGQPSLDINESKMSSVFGDVSNSQRYNEMPKCKQAYIVYTYNYQRGVSEAMEDHMHQFESQFRHIDSQLYEKFIGPYGQVGKDQSCGWSHFPPNAERDYDWENPRTVMTDCFNWNPQGTGKKEQVTCTKWNCNSIDWFTMWMQTIPGKDNTFTYNGKKLSNFWYFIANWNEAISGKESF